MNDTVRPPTGWQAVYALVSDSETRVMRRFDEVNERVDGLTGKLDTHFLGHMPSISEARQRRNNRLAAGKAFVSTVLPIPAAILAILAILSK